MNPESSLTFLASPFGPLARLVSGRGFAVLGAGLGVCGLLGALALQHVWKMEPCPLCVFQRVALILASLACAASAGFWRIAPRLAAAGAVLAVMLALGGAGLAGKHMHVMWVPQEVSCGPDLEYMMEAFPPTKWIPQVFSGSAECRAAAKELVLGAPIPVWSALLFLLQALLAGAALRERQKNPTVGAVPGA